MNEPTPTIVQGLWSHLANEFDTTIVEKASAPEMQVAAFALERIGVMNGEEFLRQYATTLGRRVYVPFRMGVPERGWTLWSQLTVAVHEHQHVVQLDEHGAIPFGVRYLTPAGRTM